MEIILNIMCNECGNFDNFLELDHLDYVNKNSFAEYICKDCGKRIIIERYK